MTTTLVVQVSRGRSGPRHPAQLEGQTVSAAVPFDHVHFASADGTDLAWAAVGHMVQPSQSVEFRLSTRSWIVE